MKILKLVTLILLISACSKQKNTPTPSSSSASLPNFTECIINSYVNGNTEYKFTYFPDGRLYSMLQIVRTTTTKQSIYLFRYNTLKYEYYPTTDTTQKPDYYFTYTTNKAGYPTSFTQYLRNLDGTTYNKGSKDSMVYDTNNRLIYKFFTVTNSYIRYDYNTQGNMTKRYYKSSPASLEELDLENTTFDNNVATFSNTVPLLRWYFLGFSANNVLSTSGKQVTYTYDYTYNSAKYPTQWTQYSILKGEITPYSTMQYSANYTCK